MWLLFFSLFLTGLLVKATDELIDSHKKQRLALLPGIAYGIIGALTVTQTPLLAPLAIGIIVGVAATKKIDGYPHLLGAFAFAAVFLYFMPQLNVFLVMVFAAGALIDELGNELADQKKLKGIVQKFFHYRLSLEAIALSVSVLTNRWEFIAAIALFDAGYIIAEKISGKAILASQ